MRRQTPNLENKGSLITYRDGDTDRCLGYLFHSPEHGTYDADLGRVDVTSEEADAHNRLLSDALIKGLDERCAVGTGGTFYLRAESHAQVRTWTGDVVSSDVEVRGNAITFHRKGMTFRGRLPKDGQAFHFTRVS